MMMKTVLCLSVVLMLAACVGKSKTATKAQPQHYTDGKHYFTAMDYPGYRHPARLSDEISETEFRQRAMQQSIYIGHYCQGRLVRFEKIRQGRTEYAFTYTYGADGRLQSVQSIKQGYSELKSQ